MDPTAPNNNSLPQDPNAPLGPKSPIQPGQFVVAGEDEEVAKNVSSQSPSPESQNPQPQPFSSPQSPQQVPSTLQEPAQAVPGPSVLSPLAGDTPTSNENSDLPSNFASPFSGPRNLQPDPTPFVSPQMQPQQTKETGPMLPPSPSSPIKKIVLIFGVLILIGLITAVAWFFIINKNGKETAQNKDTQKSQIEEPSPLPKRTSGGFSELPPATSEASPSASLEASPVPKR